jgi:hypothetical protein
LALSGSDSYCALSGACRSLKFTISCGFLPALLTTCRTVARGSIPAESITAQCLPAPWTSPIYERKVKTERNRPLIHDWEQAMDAETFARVVSVLATRPSRRAVSRGLVGLTAGSWIAFPRHQLDARGDVSGRVALHDKDKDKNKNKNKKKTCPGKEKWCGTKSPGAKSQCCGGDSGYICTTCGCCEEGFTNCCTGKRHSLCCGIEEVCVHGGTDDFRPGCCPKDHFSCGSCSSDGVPKCCPTGYKCCENRNCCHPNLTCCNDGKGSCCFSTLNCPCTVYDC